MVVIEQLRISPDCQKLFIDAHINKASYFDNIMLDSINIDTQDTVLQSFDGPSDTPVFTYPSPSDLPGTSDPPIEESPIEKVAKASTILTGQSFVQALNEETGALILDITSEDGSNNSYITLEFQGEYDCSESTPLALQITALGEEEFTKSIQGQLIDTEQNLWEFKDKFTIGNYTQLMITLVKIGSEEVQSVPFSSTLNVDSLNFTYNIGVEQVGLGFKEVHLVVDKSAINADLSKDMLYVYFSITGIPSPDTPCRLDEIYTLGVTFNEGAIYNRMMGYTKEIINTCEVPKGFIDMILQLEAVKASIETENYASANKFYRRLINTKSSVSTSNINCGCHG